MIQLSELVAWLGNPSDPEAPGLLVGLEERAVATIERETARHFGPVATHVETLVGDGTRKLRLRERPTEITSVEERQRPGDAWTEVTDTADDGWELSTPPRLPTPSSLLRKNGIPWRRGYEYRVTYEFGYAEGEEPSDIRQAVMDIVAVKYQERGREGVRGETIGDYSYSIMATAMGTRQLFTMVPGLAETIARWRGAVLA